MEIHLLPSSTAAPSPIPKGGSRAQCISIVLFFLAVMSCPHVCESSEYQIIDMFNNQPLPNGGGRPPDATDAFLNPSGTVVYWANEAGQFFVHDLVTHADTPIDELPVKETAKTKTTFLSSDSNGPFVRTYTIFKFPNIDASAPSITPVYLADSGNLQIHLISPGLFPADAIVSVDGSIMVLREDDEFGSGHLFAVDPASQHREPLLFGGEQFTSYFIRNISISDDGNFISAIASSRSSHNFFVAVFGRHPVGAPVAHVHDLVVSTDPGQPTATVAASAFDNGSTGSSLSFAASPAGPYPVGTTAVTITVSNSFGSSIGHATIVVQDHEPPRVTCGALNPILLADDHSLVDVGLLLDARDNVRVIDIDIAITQNEPVSAGPGDPSPDAVVRTDSAGHILGLKLRAEHDPSGHGRVYLIATTAIDTSGNRSTALCTVVVPKSSSFSDLFDAISLAVVAQMAGVSLPYNSLTVVGSG